MASPAAALIPRATISGAVAALLHHLSTSTAAANPQLLAAGDDLLHLVLTLRRIPSNTRLNPRLLPLPHPLFSADSSAAGADSGAGASPSVCLFVDDRRPSPSPPQILAQAQTLALPIDDVIPLSKLRTDYRPYEARRRLCDSHDLFLADRAILPLLPRLIGKEFFRKKKIPLPVDFSRAGWPEQVKRCLGSAPLFVGSGTCVVVRVGRSSMTAEEVVDNVVAVLEGAVEWLPQKWGGLRSAHVKAVGSVALPIYQAVPAMGLKIEAKGDEARKRKAVATEEPRKEAAEGEAENVLPKRKKLKGRIHDLLAEAGSDIDHGVERKAVGKVKEQKKKAKRSGGEVVVKKVKKAGQLLDSGDGVEKKTKGKTKKLKN